MLIGASLLLLMVIVILSLVLGGGFTSAITEIGISNEAIIDGVPTTFEIEAINLIFGIDVNSIVGAIGIISAIYIIGAGLTGITVVSTGLNAQSAKLIILASGYGAIWIMMSIVAYPLIVSIQFFGAFIYVLLSIGFVIGVAQSLAGGD